MNSLISVILPNYNSEKYITSTVHSIISQTYTNWELIVVDDCSTDDSIDIIKKIALTDSRIKLTELEINNGRPAIPRNIGVKAAKGDYIAFIDSDDLWHPQKLEIQMEIMSKFKISFISTELYRFRKEKEVNKYSDTNINIETVRMKRITHDSLLYKNFIITSSVLANKKLFSRDISFIEDSRYKAIEDYHCWLTIHQKKIPFSLKIKNKLVYYRLANTSISKSKLGMVKKNWILLSEYLVKGKNIGSKKYLYLLSYIFFSILTRIKWLLSKLSSWNE